MPWSSGSRLLLYRRVSLPDLPESIGQCLPFRSPVGMTGVAGKDELAVIALRSKHSRHFFVSLHLVVHAVAHLIVVMVSDFEPEAQRLDRAVRNQRFVITPGAAGRVGISWPLVVDICARVGEHAMVQIRAIPCHAQGGGTAGTAAHCGAAVGSLGQFQVVQLLDERQDFVFDEVGIFSGERVGRKTTLDAPCITAAVAD
jgi:hypothetical protein